MPSYDFRGAMRLASLLDEASSQYFSAADSASLSTGDFNFATTGFFYLNSHLTTASQQFIFYKGSGGVGGEAEHNLRIFGDAAGDANKIRFTVSDGLTEGNALGPVITVGQWYFFYTEHDATANTVRLIINNTDIFSTSYSAGGQNTTFGMDIGRTGDHDSSHFDGRVVNMRFWKKILADGEQFQVCNNMLGLNNARMNALMGSLLTGIEADWMMDAASTVDSEGSNTLTNNGSITSIAGMCPIT